jgi:hypothetical protein
MREGLLHGVALRRHFIFSPLNPLSNLFKVGAMTENKIYNADFH